MKILVPIKRVPSYEKKVKIASDNASIEKDRVSWIVNPFDEIAIVEAVRIKEHLQSLGHACSVVLATIGSEDVLPQIHIGLAFGADDAVHVVTQMEVDSSLAAQVLEQVYRKDAYDMILMGKQAIDSDANQTAQLLAAQLDVAQACFASKIEISDKTSAMVTREVDGGLETVRINLPAVVSADLRLCEPRYPSMIKIAQAKKKQITKYSLEELVPSPSVKVKIKLLQTPPVRSAGKMVGSVDELVKALIDEARVIG
jgi:electron transfer flavoprotein beta subunit